MSTVDCWGVDANKNNFTGLHTEAGFSEVRDRGLVIQPCESVTIGRFTSKVKKILLFVNPKLKCHPKAQSRNVTFYFRRMQSSPRRSLASIEFSMKSKRLQACVMGTVPRFCFGLAAARAAAGCSNFASTTFPCCCSRSSINGVRQWPLLIFNRDLTVAVLTYRNVRAAHGVGRPLGFDLIDHTVVGKRQVLR